MEKMFLLALLLILIGTLWLIGNQTEGFVETIEDRLQDRANPLAAITNPLQNPAVPIGISVNEAEARRDTAIAALNVPTEIPNADGSFRQVQGSSVLSPRIDNEESMLGLIQFCKEEGSKSGNPFQNAKFAQNCGVCFSSGSLLSGETFSTPTGVLVYDKDKEKALKKQQESGLLFPRVIPSMNAAVCKNASVTEDSMPVLAITSDDYNAFSKRLACRHAQAFGNECGICQGNKEWSWINPRGGLQGITLYLWGEGELVVKLNGRPTTEKPYTLNESKANSIELGRVKEGTTIQFDVRKAETANGPYLYGALVSANANNKPYRISIDKFIQKDVVTGSTPRKSTPRFYVEVKMSLPKIVASGTYDHMVLDGILPFTFLEKDQLAGYDCPTSPIFQNLDSADLLIQDPCIRPGPKSAECIRSRILEGGCSTDGTLYKDDAAVQELSVLSAGDLRNYITKLVEDSNKKDVRAGKVCLGKDFSTPCDVSLLEGGTVTDKCIEFLYENKGKDYPRIGSTYPSNTQYSSLNQKDIQFCQRNGALHPSKPEGLSELMNIVNGYKGLRGIPAIKLYLSDVYTKATSNLDANIRDENGGKKDSFMKCFGYTLAEAPLPTVKLNSLGTVTTDVTEDCVLSIDYTPRINWLWNSNFIFRENYSLSFTIKPTGYVNTWGNIIHFTIDGNMGKFGERSPAIWFWPNSTNLHVRIGDRNDTNWGFDTTPCPLNQESKFRLECNGNTVTCTLNNNTWTFTQPTKRFTGYGKIYLGDPWHPAARCEIKKLCYSAL